MRADEQRMARDLTEETSPVSTLASPKSEKLPAGHLLARTDGAEALMCWRDEPENGSNEPRRRRRRAHAAQSGQSPHLDPCQCRPGGSPAVGPRACSVGLESAGARNARLGALALLSAQTSREWHRPDREDITCEYIDVATSDLPPCRSSCERARKIRLMNQTARPPPPPPSSATWHNDPADVVTVLSRVRALRPQLASCGTHRS